MKRAIAGIVLIACLLVGPSVFSQELSAADLMERMKSALDLGFKQQDAIKPYINQYVKVIHLLREQGPANDKTVKIQVQILNQELEQQLKSILTDEQMTAFKSLKKSLLASN